MDSLIDLAQKLPDKYDELKPMLGKPAMMRWDEFPDITLHKLEVLARNAYLGGLHLLRNAEVAYQAEDLARSVVECLAHVVYVAGLAPMVEKRTTADRALCVELGMIRGLHDLLKKFPDDALQQDPRTVRKSVTDEEVEIRRLHAATGCRCGGRSSGNVGPTLRKAATAVGTPWTTLSGVYSSASTFMHQALNYRMMIEVSPGVTDWVAAPDEHRWKLLTWLVASYELLVTQVLHLCDPAMSGEFHEFAMHVLRQAKAAK